MRKHVSPPGQSFRTGWNWTFPNRRRKDGVCPLGQAGIPLRLPLAHTTSGGTYINTRRELFVLWCCVTEATNFILPFSPHQSLAHRIKFRHIHHAADAGRSRAAPAPGPPPLPRRASSHLHSHLQLRPRAPPAPQAPAGAVPAAGHRQPLPHSVLAALGHVRAMEPEVQQPHDHDLAGEQAGHRPERRVDGVGLAGEARGRLLVAAAVRGDGRAYWLHDDEPGYACVR